MKTKIKKHPVVENVKIYLCAFTEGGVFTRFLREGWGNRIKNFWEEKYKKK